MIRLATINDLVSIVEIYNQTIPLRYVTADLSPVTVNSRIEWFNQFNEKRPLWVSENDGNISGWASLRNFYGRPAYDKTVEIGIYIHEKYRKLGIGEELLLHAHRESHKINIENILAFVFANNNGSVNFFKKHGYLEYGLLPKVAEIDEKKIDLMILGYSL